MAGGARRRASCYYIAPLGRDKPRGAARETERESAFPARVLGESTPQQVAQHHARVAVDSRLYYSYEY